MTDTAIRKAKPGLKPAKLTDGKGLFLLVTTTGSKLWRYQYRFQGKPKLISFGAYPEVPLATRVKDCWKPEPHSPKAFPSAQRQALKQAQKANGTTFEDVFKLWHEHWKEGKSPRHADYVLRRVEADVLPKIGQLPLLRLKSQLL